jgi:glucose-6-phosphate dehydrogenase assembly protein OpcA
VSGSLRIFTHQPRRLRLDAVEGELDRLWHHPDHVGEGHTRLTRTCRSNLIVLCSSPTEAEQVDSEISTLVQYQPCRILLFVPDENDRSNNIETQISTYIGEERQVLAEQVTIRAGAAAVQRLQMVARALLVGGLQTVLWWVPQDAPRPMSELFHGLSELAQQVLYDSFGWTDAPRSVIAMSDWSVKAPADKALFDLCWYRLNPWRQMLNDALDPSIAGEPTKNVQSLTIRHGIGAVAQAWLFVAWFAQSLGLRLEKMRFTNAEMDWVSKATGRALRVSLRPASQPQCEIAAVDVSWSEGALNKAAHFYRARPDHQMVVYQSAIDYSQAIMLPSIPRPVALARQLATPARDANFIDALMLARAIAQTLSK